MDLIESQSLEKDFLNKVVHVPQVKVLFKDFDMSELDELEDDS